MLSYYKKLLPVKHKIKGNIIEMEFSNKAEFENFVQILKKSLKINQSITSIMIK